MERARLSQIVYGQKKFLKGKINFFGVHFLKKPKKKPVKNVRALRTYIFIFKKFCSTVYYYHNYYHYYYLLLSLYSTIIHDDDAGI